jgi:hypothetical protein
MTMASTQWPAPVLRTTLDRAGDLEIRNLGERNGAAMKIIWFVNVSMSYTKGPSDGLMRGFRRGEISDSFGAGDSRHAISGEIARRLFGERASHARSRVEGRQPEPSSSVAGCGSRWNGPRGGGEDRRHGSPDAARLGSSLQRPEDDDRSTRSSHPPLPHPRNRKRQLPLQEQLGESQTRKGETSKLDERLTPKPSSSRVSSQWKSGVNPSGWTVGSRRTKPLSGCVGFQILPAFGSQGLSAAVPSCRPAR